jgi:DNA-binding transcriptional MerR regulator
MQSTTASNERQEGGGRRTKSAGAFRTISEVADELDVAQHVLRFWESKFPQVRPLKRGGGRRYYRPEDVDLLRRIRSLLYDEGYTIKGAQKLLKSQRRSSVDRKTAPGNGNGQPQTKPLEDEAEPEKATVETSAGESLPFPPLAAEQKLALDAIRTNLSDLRDTLRKLTR